VILTQMEGDDSLESRDGDDDRSGSGTRRRLITRLVSASCVRAEWASQRVRTRFLSRLAASSPHGLHQRQMELHDEPHDGAQPLRRPSRSCKAEGSDAFLALRLQQRELEHQKRAVKSKGKTKSPKAIVKSETRVVTNHTSTSQSTEVSLPVPVRCRSRAMPFQLPALLPSINPPRVRRISQLLCDPSPSRSGRRTLHRRALRKVRRGVPQSRGHQLVPTRRISSLVLHGDHTSQRPIDRKDRRARRLTMRLTRCGFKRRNTRMVCLGFSLDRGLFRASRCSRVRFKPFRQYAATRGSGSKVAYMGSESVSPTRPEYCPPHPATSSGALPAARIRLTCRAIAAGQRRRLGRCRRDLRRRRPLLHLRL
jgi:hypothetical protein